MANKVTVQVVGGQSKTLDNVSSIADVKRALNLPNHTATLNGDTASSDTQLENYSFVHLAPAVKGGNQ